MEVAWDLNGASCSNHWELHVWFRALGKAMKSVTTFSGLFGHAVHTAPSLLSALPSFQGALCNLVSFRFRGWRTSPRVNLVSFTQSF